MASTQHYLPIIDPATKKVLGLYNLGENIEFSGLEEVYDLGDAVVNIVMWKPRPSLIRKVNTEFMAAVFTREEIRMGVHRGSARFVPLSDVYPSTEQGSSQALGNWIRQYNGPVLTGLSDTFAVGEVTP
jgi:hypothetical protein